MCFVVIRAALATINQVPGEEIEAFDKTIQDEMQVANDETEEPFVRERAREKIRENAEKKNQLVKERENSLWSVKPFASG